MAGEPHLSRDASSAGLFFDTLALQSAQLVNLGLGFATVSVLGNALSRSDFGVVALVLALVNYLFVATASWNGQAYVRFGREEFVRTRRVASSFAARTALMGIAAVATCGLLVLFRDALTSSVGLGLGWSGFFVGLLLLRVASDAVSTTFQVTGGFRDLALFQVADKALYLVAILAAWGLATGLATPAVLLAFAAGKLATILLALFRLRAGWFRPADRFLASLREQWRYSAPLLASSALGYLPLVAGPYIINHHVDAEEVARYNVAYQVYGFYQAITTTVLGLVLIPLLTDLVTEGRAERAGRLVTRFGGQLALLNGVVVALLAVLSILLLPRLLPLYGDAVPVLVLLLAGSSWQVLVTAYSAMLAALRSSRPVALVNAVGGLAFTAATWFLIPLGGALALAGAWAGWYLLSGLAYRSALRRGTDVGPAAGLLPPTLALAAGVTVALFAARPLAGVVAALAAAAGLLVVARAAGWFHRADLVHLERLRLPAAVRRAVWGFFRLMDRGGDPAGPA